MPALTVCGVAELESRRAAAPTHVLSIWHPQAEDAWLDWVRRLFPSSQVHFSRFDDARREREDLQGPSRSDLEEILAFGRGLTPDDSLLVHCAAGISRSPAAAYAILCQLTSPGLEPACLQHVLDLRPIAWPNQLMIRWADEILDREQRMVSALAQLDSP